VDPTNDFQRGPLHQRFLPPYGKALLIRPGETALRDLQPAGWKETAVENEAQFFLSDLSESARLSLVTTRTGEQADGHRALLALIDRTEIAKSRLNEMARWFPGAVATYAPQYADDEPNNRLVRREEYEIPHFWETWQDDPGHFNADVLPFIIYDCVRKPDTTVRTSPLGVPYPLRIHERYTVHFAAPGDFQNAEWSLDDSAFRYRCAVHGQGKDLTIDHWFETLADFVPPERMPSYLENLRKVREGSVYGIRVPKDNAPAPDPSSRLSASPAPSSPSGVAHLMVPFVALCTLFIALFAAVLYLLWRPEWRMYPDDTYHGLGGWLVVVAIGLVFGPLAQLAAAGYNVQFLDENTWRQMTAPGGSLYHPLWAGIILVEVAYNVGMLVASVVLLILFFRKRRTFPLLYMIVLVLSAFFTSADTVAVHFVCLEVPNFPKPAPNHAGAAMLRAFIWIPYMLMSKRVRSTFIRGGPRRHH
jgi:hypothetical protein